MVIESENDTKKSHLPGTLVLLPSFWVYSSFELLSKFEEDEQEKVFNGKQYSEIQIF